MYTKKRVLMRKKTKTKSSCISLSRSAFFFHIYFSVDTLIVHLAPVLVASSKSCSKCKVDCRCYALGGLSASYHSLWYFCEGTLRAPDLPKNAFFLHRYLCKYFDSSFSSSFGCITYRQLPPHPRTCAKACGAKPHRMS